MKTIGLRVDADTYAGTRDGVPALLTLLAGRKIRASFFFSVGPDNMGRHLWRILRPAFLRKMLRSNAPFLYGPRILLAGTAWPGRRIAETQGRIMRQCLEEGHEAGLHAWDHHAWQKHMPDWPVGELRRQSAKGLEALEAVLGSRVHCSAAPGWRADGRVVEAKETFAFTYNSDCRGERPFRPRLADGRAATPQIPVSLPTYDEVIGREVREKEFNTYILNAVHACRGVPVYTIHAEVEGMSRAGLFADLMDKAAREGMRFCPLRDLLPPDPADLPWGSIELRPFPGREGLLGIQCGEDAERTEAAGHHTCGPAGLQNGEDADGTETAGYHARGQACMQNDGDMRG
ncbi:MAG: 4-deoxy-4-formamido-L-arabinose-phosphoundecaprenol deformylase [Desulfovibrio sp.]|jgi:undecaprenyl phosphate-alpha-L-ara4FN deformylase|nr:4-deoxy-4-formamido-L-arabinose-phosphoundecaprenol deformylase [Desulfovibrio sp.]